MSEPSEPSEQTPPLEPPPEPQVDRHEPIKPNGPQNPGVWDDTRNHNSPVPAEPTEQHNLIIKQPRAR